MVLYCGEKTIDTDNEGYLRHLSDWSHTVAIQIAATESITLTEEHWEIINFLRAFYHTYQLTPVMRIVVKEIGKKLGSEKGKSAHLMKLFSGTPLRVATKIAGLPKPSHCL